MYPVRATLLEPPHSTLPTPLSTLISTPVLPQLPPFAQDDAGVVLGAQRSLLALQSLSRR